MVISQAALWQRWLSLLLLCSPLASGVRTNYFAEEQVSTAFEWNTERAGWDDVSCGERMKVARVQIPWETMNSRVEHARSLADCQACAEDLMVRDILQRGWECRSAWFGRYNIYREADITLGPKTPLHTFNLTEANLSGSPLPILPATSPLPSALRGIFWLSAQGDSSALLTFAKNDGEDCRWCNTGKLIGNGYRIRVQGNCNWAFAAHEGFWTSGYAYARNMRLIYDWIFDDPENPTFAHIGPVVRALPFNLGAAVAKLRWLVHFEMRLESPGTAAELGYPGSVVWRRRTYLLASISTFPYHLVQVVDEDGNRIQPAWDQFVEYQQSAEAGDTPGLIYHHGCEAEQ